MAMSNQKSPEFQAAMEALEHLAKKYGFEPTEKQRQLFWLGAKYGVQRGHEKALSQPKRQKKPLLKKKTIEMRAIRDSKADSSAVPGNGPDIGEGGVFKL